MHHKLALCLCVALLAGLVSPEAQARSFRVSQVPNGGQFGCGLCHQGGRSGAPRNAFGLQVEELLGQPVATANVPWTALVALDADEDGFTNGEELGDPEGAWRVNDPAPQRSTSDPNDESATPAPCGNGALDLGEQCDRAAALTRTCQEEGFLGGTLRCATNCTLDTSACTSCGNNTRDNGEECDGEDLGGASCQDQGFGRGALRCGANCRFETALCSNCGNNLRDGQETCDGDDLAGQTCWSLGFDGGALACDLECGFDLSACEGDPAQLCSDGVRNGDEACDGEDLGGASCESLGFGRGALSCRPDCELDTSACVSCGNDTIDEGEDCDGEDLGGASCERLGFDGGELRCNEGCRLQTTGCVNDPPDMGEVDLGTPDAEADVEPDVEPDVEVDVEPDVEVDLGEPDVAPEDQGAPDVVEDVVADAPPEELAPDLPQEEDAVADVAADAPAQDQGGEEEEAPAPPVSGGGDGGGCQVPVGERGAPGALWLAALVGAVWLRRQGWGRTVR